MTIAEGLGWGVEMEMSTPIFFYLLFLSLSNLSFLIISNCQSQSQNRPSQSLFLFFHSSV